MKTTPELEQWMGEFGDDYTDRNASDDVNITQREAFFAQLFSTLPVNPLDMPKSVLEIGANIGSNLKAIDNLYKNHDQNIQLFGLEPNKKANKILKTQGIRNFTNVQGAAQSIAALDSSFDIVFTCGVLIHIHPDTLYEAMSEIYRVSKKYIICAEYFSPEPRSRKYRGQDGLLWTRDFGEEWLKNFKGLRCTGYGFAWKRMTGMDNITWWNFQKTN